MQRFGAHDNGATVSLVVGERFSLTLEEHPSTGYRWDTERSYDGVLEVLRDAHVAHYAPERLGGGGTHEWLYEAAAPGRCTLTLRLRRPWSGASAPDSYRLTVSVTPKGEDG